MSSCLSTVCFVCVSQPPCSPGHSPDYSNLKVRWNAKLQLTWDQSMGQAILDLGRREAADTGRPLREVPQL